MDKKSKTLLVIFLLLIIGSVALTFYRIMIRKDYVIENQVDCDPTINRCFIWKCDPASDVEGEGCTGDASADLWYYQVVQRNASHIPLCNPDTDDACDPWTCSDGEKDCATIFCDDQTKITREAECSDPEQYNLDNPSEEESSVCEGGVDCIPQDETSNVGKDSSIDSTETAE